MQTPTPPDVDVLIHGGRVRRRRRNVTRIGVAAATVVLAGGVAYGVSQIDPGGPRSDPGIVGPAARDVRVRADPARRLPDGDRAPIEPGTFRTFVGYDAAGATDRGRPDRHRDGLGERGLPRGLRGRRPGPGSVSTDRCRCPTGPVAPVTGRRPPRGRDDAGAGRTARPTPAEHGRPTTRADRGVRPRRPPPAAADRRQLPDRPGVPRSRDVEGVGAASATATSPRRSSSTSGSWTWTGPRSWSTRGTNRARRPTW